MNGLGNAVYPVRSAVIPVPMEPDPVGLVTFVVIEWCYKNALNYHILFVAYVQKTFTLILFSIIVFRVMIVAIAGTTSILENAI